MVVCHNSNNMFGNYVRVVIMKKFFVILVCFFAINNIAQAKNLDPYKMLKIIESNDEEKLCNFFQQLDDVYLEEAQQFIFNLFKIVQTKHENFGIASTK